MEPLIALELCSVLGDHKQLMVWIKRAYEERSTIFLYIPMMKYLYGDDPEVLAFLERRRLP